MEDYLYGIHGMNNNIQLDSHIRETLHEEMHHGLLVSNLASMLAEELGQNQRFCHNIAIAGVLHDLGKMKLTRYLYSTEHDTLMVEQLKYMRMHSTYSYEILMDAGYEEEIAQAVYHHHENYDGSGYPDSLRGEDIPLMSRILRICDVYCALTSNRNYRKAFEPKAAMEIMIEEVGDYDMGIFLAFQRMLHSDGFVGLEELRSTVQEFQFHHLEMFEKEALQE